MFVQAQTPIRDCPCGFFFFGFAAQFTLALILEYNTPLTLANTLRSYQKGGLLEYVNETVIYIQETNEAKQNNAHKYGLRPIGSVVNTKLHVGFDTLVRNASTEYVLFLEKDWELVESAEMLAEQMDTAIQLIEDGVAHVVRLRNRARPGHDFYAKETYQGREERVFSSQPNLLCNFYHWIDHPEDRWPFAFTKCHTNPDFVCVKAEYCNWTNNPVIFRKQWWLDHMAEWANYPNLEARFTNFENLLNNIPKSWNAQPWIVGLGAGLFVHHEIDG
eukprot:c13884_g1_i1.p1 GENE.c13884_g1_i1~~c13884_g1_i1.p1  ORF type:complete len:275 (+),score=56.40 c13884_g1_i1:265-1089(+)